VYRWAARLFPADAEALAGVRAAARGLEEAREPHVPRPSTARQERTLLISADDGARVSGARLGDRARLLGAVTFLTGGSIFLGLGLRMIDMFTAYAVALLVGTALAAAVSAFFPGHKRLAFKSALAGTTIGSLAILFAAFVATVIR
jgi:multidrug transporter EmrE-like cation transporter